MADEQECLRDLEGEIGEQEGAEGETQRLTAQWSVEDEEEAARERRRRERERQLRSQAEEGLNSTSEVAVQESRIDGKPPGTLELEEDEGFSDWSQKLEQLKQRSGAEGVQERDQILQRECREAQEPDPIQCEESPRSPRRSYEEEDSNLKEAEVMLEQVNLDQETPTFIRFETGPSNFLKFVSTSTSEDQPEAELEQQQQQQQQLRETLELGEENQHAEDKLQENVTEEDKPEEEEVKQEGKKRRLDEQEEIPEKQQRAPSTSSQEDEYQAPLSPTLKITDRTESLNRSVQKSNSMKKNQAPLPVSKIDDKLEQYTQAIEISSKTPKPARQASIDLPTNSAAVASTKSLWETGEVTQSTKSVPCKDIVAGDIVNIRSLWEQKENPQTDANSKVKIPGKKYKYVAVGHGQYKRVPIEDDGMTEK